MRSVHAAGCFEVNSYCDHAGEDKHVDLLSDFSSAHFNVERAGKVETDVVKRLELDAESTVQKWSHQLRVDGCLQFLTFRASRLDLTTKCSHAVDGKLVSNGGIHGLDANWMLMLDVSSFDYKSGVIRFGMKDDWVSLFVSETRNFCKPRSASHDSSWVQKRVELLNRARLGSSDFCQWSKIFGHQGNFFAKKFQLRLFNEKDSCVLNVDMSKKF
jgi:hypothetical protein